MEINDIEVFHKYMNELEAAIKQHMNNLYNGVDDNETRDKLIQKLFEKVTLYKIQ